MWSILQPISILFNCGLLLQSILSSDYITIGNYIPIMITMQFFATKKIALFTPKSQALLQEHEDGHCELHKDLPA